MDYRWPNLSLLIIILFVAYILFTLYAHFMSNKMLFRPPKPSSYQDNSSILKLSTSDHKKISAIYLPEPKSKFVILYSHGNAVDLGKLSPLLKEFNAHGYAIFSYDYHGYGTSEGRPSEYNTYLDIYAAYDYLTNQLHIPPSKIILMGSSLGAGVSLELGVHKPIAGIILTGPFVSAYRVYTLIPILFFDKFNNLKKIEKINVPILIVHGDQDQVIPIWHGKKLYNAIKGRKQALWVTGADHSGLINTAGEQFWIAIQKFISSL